MAMARTRTAISLCCNGIRQVSVRRFEAGAGQTNYNSNKGVHSSVQPCPSRGLPIFSTIFPVMMFCNWWSLVKERHAAEEAEDEANAQMRKKLEERGVSRASCEAKIAEVKQRIESGTERPFDRMELMRHEEWLKAFTRGPRKRTYF